MATAYESVASATDTHGGSFDTLTISKPSGTAEGDLMVAALGINGAGSTYSLAGWDLVGIVSDGSASRLTILSKVAGDSEPSSYAFTVNGSSNDGMAGFIARFSGDGFGGAENLTYDLEYDSGALSHTFSDGIDVIATDSVLMIGSFSNDDLLQSGYAITNNNPTWTERVDINDGAPTKECGIAMATATPSATGSTGDWSIEYSSDDGALGFLIFVREDTDGSVTGSVGQINMVGNVGTPVGAANITGSVGQITVSGNVGTTEEVVKNWTPQDKSGNSGWTAQSKS